MPDDQGLSNMQARAVLLSQGVPCKQRIASVTVDPAAVQNIVNVVPRAVGILLGFQVVVTATFSNNHATIDLTRTDHNVANLINRVIFTDPGNYQRINTRGWHLALIDAVKSGMPSFAAYSVDTAIGYGPNYTPFVCPSAVAHGATGTLRAMYNVPCAYGPSDLRGAVFMNLINATSNLQLQINSAPVVDANGDATGAIFTGSAGATGLITTMTIDVYQIYIDQIPLVNGKLAYPKDDLNIVYELKDTTLTGMAVSSWFSAPFSNFRDYLSTSLLYDNTGVLTFGTDITDFRLTTANFYSMFQQTPLVAAADFRKLVGTDPPKGVHFFDHRRKPISTYQYGNQTLDVLFSSVTGSASKLLVGYETMGKVNTMLGAGSLGNA